MRFLAVLAFAVAVGVSHASFDLILQADIDSTLGTHIDRYDPVSRVYLGSFPVISSPLGPGAMAASRQRQELYIRGSQNTVRVYNYSTGDYLRSFTLLGTQLAVSDDGNTLYSTTGSGGLFYADLTTGTVNGMNLSGSTQITALALGADGRILVYDATSTTFRSYSSLGQLLATSPAQGAFANLTERVAPGTSNRTFYAVETLGSNMITGVTDNVATLTEVTSSTSYTRVNSLVEAHAGMWLIGESNVSPGVLRYSRMDMNGFIGPSFAMSQTTITTGATAIVLAPEPGSMIALGAGVAWLMRRRKRS